jgi:hypothetical protein
MPNTTSRLQLGKLGLGRKKYDALEILKKKIGLVLSKPFKG